VAPVVERRRVVDLFLIGNAMALRINQELAWMGPMSS
jgi:hypothetical protein